MFGNRWEFEAAVTRLAQRWGARLTIGDVWPWRRSRQNWGNR